MDSGLPIGMSGEVDELPVTDIPWTELTPGTPIEPKTEPQEIVAFAKPTRQWDVSAAPAPAHRAGDLCAGAAGDLFRLQIICGRAAGAANGRPRPRKLYPTHAKPHGHL